MPRDKTKGGVPNKHLHARISFLQQAATYLTLRRDEAVKAALSVPDVQPQDTTRKASLDRNSGESGLPNRLNSHLRQIALKSQIRLHPTVKHHVCKVCNTTLAEGQTCSKIVENKSRNSAKPHADVLVVKCNICGTPKRFPIGAQRQQSKSERREKKASPRLAGNAAPGAVAAEVVATEADAAVVATEPINMPIGAVQH